MSSSRRPRSTGPASSGAAAPSPCPPSPTLALLAVLAFIFAMQQFTLIFLTTGGGPGESTTTLSVQIYNEAFQFFDYGYASAIAVVGLLLSVLGTILFVVIERRVVRSRS